MKKLVLFALSVVCTALWTLPAQSQAAPLLQLGDPILAIDTDPPVEEMRVSEYPAGEPPSAALDGFLTSKYLNFGTLDTGFIVTPLFGTSQVRSMQFRTANDAVGRDPASWALWGTNDPITSVEHSNGSAENWTLISEAPIALPDTRLTLGPVLSFSNSASYTSYRLIFPTIKDFPAANSMQIGDVFMFQSTDGSGSTILSEFDPVIAVQLEPVNIVVPDSASPAAEQVENLLDGDTTEERIIGGVPTQVLTKYLNFGKENSGFIVSPSVGAATVTSFQVTTAFDAAGRDPASWELYGTNSTIMSTNHSRGDGEPWTLIDMGTLELPMERDTAGPIVDVTNTTAYASYRMIFPTLRDTAGAGVDSMQIAGIQFFADDIAAVPGDYNGNGTVDAADYVVWRNGGPLLNEVPGVTPGTVTAEDYTAWRARFGNTSGSGSATGSAAVPEPAAATLVAIAVLAASLAMRRRSRIETLLGTAVSYQANKPTANS